MARPKRHPPPERRPLSHSPALSTARKAATRICYDATAWLNIQLA
jgi:hypothetical protein